MKYETVFTAILCAWVLAFSVGRAYCQSSAITYQGHLKSGNSPANGQFDFVFSLFDDPTAGAQVGNAVTNLNASVTNGLFATTIDFGTNSFTGADRWLKISVRTNGTGADFSELLPRQAISPTPYALYALNGQPGPAGPQGTNGVAGPAGTTGQSAVTVYGSGSVSPGLGNEALIPGLMQTISVPTNCVVYISTDGGVRTGTMTANGYSQVEIYFKLDDAIPTNGGYADINAINNNSKLDASARWSLSLSTELAPGSHTVAVYSYRTAGNPASVSGGTGTVDQGELTVMVLKK